MARHYYDLYQLIRHGIAARAIADKNLFEQVVNHRRVFFSHNWVDYDTLRRGSLRMLPLPEQHAGWREDYAAMRGEMFSTEPPTFDTLLDAIRAIESEFNAIATDK